MTENDRERAYRAVLRKFEVEYTKNKIRSGMSYTTSFDGEGIIITFSDGSVFYTPERADP